MGIVVSSGERFDVETAKQMFGFRGKDPDGQGVDVSIIERHYHPDVVFKDAIQKVVGRDAVIAMMLRLPKRVRELRNTVHSAAQEGDVIFVEWTCEMLVHPRVPWLANEGASRLRLDADGLVVEHRDYFDLWGDLIDSFPRVSRLYRGAVRHME